MLPSAAVLLALSWWVNASRAFALEYAYVSAEPQKHGWPLSDPEEQYVLRPEFERRPGSESRQHLPKLWPVVPSAGFWSGRTWLDAHEKLCHAVRLDRGPVDILLVGDSITQQWGGGAIDRKPFNPAWRQTFGRFKTVNIGIGGDKIQNILWRLDHGGVDGLEPRVVVLMAGNNNMFFSPETGVEAVAEGLKVCLANLRERFPGALLVLVKTLPAHAPGNRFYEDIRATNALVDRLGIGRGLRECVLDMTADFVEPSGVLRDGLFERDRIHLTQELGYGLYARRLHEILEGALK